MLSSAVRTQFHLILNIFLIIMRLIALLALVFGLSCTLAYPPGPPGSRGNTGIDDSSADQYDGHSEISAIPSESGDDDANVDGSSVRPKRTVPIIVVGRPYGYGYGNYGYGWRRRPYYGGYPGYWQRPYYGYY